jgi:hypothetical protein
MPLNKIRIHLMKAIVSGLALVISVAISFAASSTAIDKVQFQSGKVLLWPGGQTLMAPNEASLPFSVVVKTNGTFTVQGGKMRSLQEGEIIGKDGMLTKPDGTVQPVVDHVSLLRGRVIVVTDGESAVAQAQVKLGDGTTIDPDGKITPPSSSPRRLLDGEVFQLKGGALPSRDTITLQDGKVRVQKDGSVLIVEPTRSVMMNDGTKVFGNGKITYKNGQETQLAEGQIIILEGVVTRPR